MTSSPRFIHLRTHTEYSLLEGAVRCKKLPGMCADMGMPAVAITDTNSLFAALEFSVTAQGAGIQPMVTTIKPIAANDQGDGGTKAASGSTGEPIAMATAAKVVMVRIAMIALDSVSSAR